MDLLKSLNGDGFTYAKGVIASIPLLLGLLAWWRHRRAFLNSQRLSELTVEIAQIFNAIREEAVRLVGVNRQLGGASLAEVFVNPVQLRAVYGAGKLQKKRQQQLEKKLGRKLARELGEVVLRLKTPELTKALAITLRNWLFGYLGVGRSELHAAGIKPSLEEIGEPRRKVFYAFMRRDVWSDDQYQGFRLILIPQWCVEQTLLDPSWLNSIHWDVSYQEDRVDHIREVTRLVSKVRSKEVKDLMTLGVFSVELVG